MNTLAAAEPPHVPLARVFLVSSAVLTAEIVLMQLWGRSWQESLLPGYLLLTVTFGAVFVLAAVTVAGFVAGAAAAGLVALGAASLPQVLAGAAVLALLCGVAPGWRRVEAWQATRTLVLTAGEEAGVARGASAPASTAGRLRGNWRLDRVAAAFLVLAFPPAMASFAVWFVGWVATR